MSAKNYLRKGPHKGRVNGCASTFAALSLAVVLWTGVAVPAGHAQDPDVQSLLQKVQRLQRELNTLQRHVFQGGTPPVSAQGAATGAGDIGRPQAARI